MDTAPAEYDPQLDRSFRGHKGPIHALDFNVNMKQLAGASLDHCVYVWNFRQQLRAFRFTGHTVCTAALSPWLFQCRLLFIFIPFFSTAPAAQRVQYQEISALIE